MAFRQRRNIAPTAENHELWRSWYRSRFPILGRSAGFSLEGGREGQARIEKRCISPQALATRTAIEAVLESPRVMATRELSLSMYTQMENPARDGARSSRKATMESSSNPKIRQVDLEKTSHLYGTADEICSSDRGWREEPMRWRAQMLGGAVAASV